jgi:hypothetical protein
MLKLAIETTNDAFQDGWTATECARILRELAARLESGETGGALRDVNGNRVGSFTLKTKGC